MTGAIPSELGNLTNLDRLQLSDHPSQRDGLIFDLSGNQVEPANQFSGTIPPFRYAEGVGATTSRCPAVDGSINRLTLLVTRCKRRW